MEEHRFDRLKLLIGTDAVEKLAQSHVIVMGVGGVGGFAACGLARSGVGSLTLIDRDIYDETNLNRQIGALDSTIGKSKVEAMKQRIAEINPHCCVTARQLLYLPETKDSLDFSSYDYVIDAVDTMTAKLLIIEEAQRAATPVISIMGTGNKLDPTALAVADIAETRICPLARILRKELRRRGIHHVPVVYSTERSRMPGAADGHTTPVKRGTPPASAIFVPATAGMIAASQVVRNLIETEDAPHPTGETHLSEVTSLH